MSAKTSFEQEFICDNKNHTSDKPAYGMITIHFWYGSKNDLKAGSIHVCDECGKKMISLLKKEFGIKDFLKQIEEF